MSEWRLRKSDGGGDRPARERGFGSRTLQLIVLGAVLLFLAITYAVVLSYLRPRTPGERLSLDALHRMGRSGEITSVIFLKEDLRVVGETDDGPFWVGLLGEVHATNLIDQLSRAGVRTEVDTQTTKALLALATQFALPAATIIVGFAFLFVIFRGFMSGNFSMLGKAQARRYETGARPPVTFADVAGLGEAVEELREIKDYLASPQSFAALGAKPPKGVLLLGPPGCGKTLLARAVAGEAGVPFFSISATEFVEMLVGVGAARIRDLFAKARAAAPSIVFIDEIDAIGRARAAGHSLNVEWESSLNELLVQLDGFDPADRVVLMAATNRADVLDSALVRKGRFDRQIVVDLPDLGGRNAIFEVHARGKPLGRDVDLEALARRTVGFSGADIASVMNEAALLAARRRLPSISKGELDEAIDRVVAGPERRSPALSDEEKRRVAYHEGGHALVGWILELTSAVDKVSIVARGPSLGGTWHVPVQEHRLKTRSQFLEEITFALAGRAAEDMVFSDPSDGAREDLKRATRLAREMVCDLGMSEAMGPRVLEVEQQEGSLLALDAIQRNAAARADEEIARILNEADARCRHVIATYRPQLERIVDLLVTRETIDRQQLEQTMGSAPRGLPATEKPTVVSG